MTHRQSTPVDTVTRFWQFAVAILLSGIAWGVLTQKVSDHSIRIDRLEQHENFYHGVLK